MKSYAHSPPRVSRRAAMACILLAAGAVSAQQGMRDSDSMFPPVRYSANVVYHQSGAYIQITMGGNWWDTCVPQGPQVKIGDQRIDYVLDARVFPGQGCGDAITPWQTEGTAGPLEPGTYEIYTQIMPEGMMLREKLEVLPPVEPCYANCDGTRNEPYLNVDDFTCFINRYAEAQTLSHEEQITHYANCDQSKTAPVLNVDDFICFMNAFAAGCR